MTRIEEIDNKIRALKYERAKLVEIDRKVKALDFIRVNNVTLDDVELSDGDGKPWFGDIWTFGKWLEENSTKRFAEWNRSIHWTHEIQNGHWIDTDVWLDDLKENK